MEVQEDKIFGYRSDPIQDSTKVRISPSQIYKFFENPSAWYKENVLKSPSTNSCDITGMTLGTILHKIYECVSIDKIITSEEIDKQLNEYVIEQNLLGFYIDINKVIQLYHIISPVIVNNYIIPFKEDKDNKVEVEKSFLINDNSIYYITGTADRIEYSKNGSITIVDYKNVSTKPKELFPFRYKIQLLAYVYLYEKLENKLVDNISIIYSVRPTTTLPSRIFVGKEKVTDSDRKLFKNTLSLITDTLTVSHNDPSLTYLLFKNMEFKK